MHFSSLNLLPELIQNLESLRFETMTPIQGASLPLILQGRDVIGQAKTGSGKTAAFGLGILQGLDVQNFSVQALILCPTRELAEQVSKALRQLARTMANVKVLSLCGGMPTRPQMSSLEHGAHIVVGTPGRVGKHLRTGHLKLDTLRFLVLDEGDRMLEMGFQDEVDAIIARAPEERQTLLFSATFPAAIESIAEAVMKSPARVTVESPEEESLIEQRFYRCGTSEEDRFRALRLLLHDIQGESTLVFCSTKLETQQLCEDLEALDFSAAALHGDLEQIDRDETLIRFSNKSVSILVATDVAARGLDIDSVDTVINFRLSKDAEVHVHRIGRTGRAGSKGLACSLCSSKDRYALDRLEAHFETRFKELDLPPSSVLRSNIQPARMSTLLLRVGKRNKIRAGNILGALTGERGIEGSQVGQIDIRDTVTYVAVSRDATGSALDKLSSETWKGKAIKAWRIGTNRSRPQRPGSSKSPW